VKEEGTISVPSTTMVKDEKNTDTKPSTTGDTALTSEASCTVNKETYNRYVAIVEALKFGGRWIHRDGEAFTAVQFLSRLTY